MLGLLSQESTVGPPPWTKRRSLIIEAWRSADFMAATLYFTTTVLPSNLRNRYDEPLQTIATEQRPILDHHIRAREEWTVPIGEPPDLPSLRLRSIPNVIPSEVNRAADFTGFLRAVYSKIEGSFERLLEGLEEWLLEGLEERLLEEWAELGIS
ncbi:hypothetical protein Sjap_024075 [Stephania japonica]|uniref:Uncharacterized protein n=1 Tax=Stephania japonica TaxID=461633 RepID=A0AAP0HJJ3_9MAGN